MLENYHTYPGKTAGSKIPEKTLSLHLRLILSTGAAYGNKIIKQNKLPILRKKENLISTVTTVFDSNVQFSTTKKHYKTYKEIGKYGSFLGIK